MSVTNNKEVEVKFKIQNKEEIRKKLINIGGETKGEFFQRGIPLDTPNGDLHRKGIFLRVRSGGVNTLTVKKKFKEDNSRYKERDEFEVEVSSIEKTIIILENLGFKKLRVIEKYREEFKFPNVTVVLDRLPFGNYMEIEGTEEEIEKMIVLLGFTNSQRITQTYWALNQKYWKEKGLDAEDIVFTES